MALVKCPECDSMVSTKARNCVGCGYPINDDPPAASSPPPPPPAAPAYSAPSDQPGQSDPLLLPCSACGRDVQHRFVRKRRPSQLLAAVAFLVIGGVIMNLSDSQSHKTITAVAFTGLALWAAVSAFRLHHARACPACGHEEFTARWHEL